MTEKTAVFDKSLTFDYENGFYLTSHLTRMGKIITHYEYYKMIIGLPGQVIECGVYKGASLVRFASFRDLLENPFSRKIVGFDIFGPFPRSGDKDDLAFVDRFESEGGDGLSKSELEMYLLHKNIVNVSLVAGEIQETLPEYCRLHPELKIALLHIDVDIYSPTLTVLQCLFDRMVKGGVVVLDDYAAVGGATRAIDDFLAEKEITIRKLSTSHASSYLVI